ncbi:hypothetical protein HZ326_26557 [Fusarium oxysporum f. sp. albedinis]|jgi:hypothetical protein|nr:hypothetical protein HZ326_26557 [Fusarium oxysporum f. sp. albedinis]
MPLATPFDVSRNIIMKVSEWYFKYSEIFSQCSNPLNKVVVAEVDVAISRTYTMALLSSIEDEHRRFILY